MVFANTEVEARTLIQSTHPDIIAVNISPSNPEYETLLSDTCILQLEVIRYDLLQLDREGKSILDHLSRAIQIICLKKGLVDVRWTEV